MYPISAIDFGLGLQCCIFGHLCPGRNPRQPIKRLKCDVLSLAVGDKHLLGKERSISIVVGSCRAVPMVQHPSQCRESTGVVVDSQVVAVVR